MIERVVFREVLAQFARELGAEIGRLGDDARRLQERGNPRFAAELVGLRERLAEIRRYAEEILVAGGPVKGEPTT